MNLCAETCAQSTPVSWALTAHSPSPDLHQYHLIRVIAGVCVEKGRRVLMSVLNAYCMQVFVRGMRQRS